MFNVGNRVIVSNPYEPWKIYLYEIGTIVSLWRGPFGYSMYKVKFDNLNLLDDEFLDEELSNHS